MRDPLAAQRRPVQFVRRGGTFVAIRCRRAGGLPKVRSIDTEPIMTARTTTTTAATRTTFAALTASLLMTLATLGSLHTLAAPEAADPAATLAAAQPAEAAQQVVIVGRRLPRA